MRTTFPGDCLFNAPFHSYPRNLYHSLRIILAYVYKYMYTHSMKPIPGLQGLYSATEDGQIYSHRGKGKFLRPYKCNGYLRVGINSVRGSGIRKSMRVHRLVAFTFIENPNPGKLDQINHIDGNRANNHISNLEWSNHSHNQKHAWDTGLNELTPARLEWLKRGWKHRNA